MGGGYATTEELVDAVARRLAAAGRRLTEHRRRVVGALAETPGPRTVTELTDVLGEAIPLSSLYRALAVLVEAGVVERLHEHDGVARYELSEVLVGHHHHLVCRRCGRVVDVAAGGDLDAAIDRLARRLGRRRGFRVRGHHIDFVGECERCPR